MRPLHFAAFILCAVITTLPAMAADIVSARFTNPTDRYDHAILGDALEWGGLEVTLDDGRRLALTLPNDRVFEDVEPRLVALPGGGQVVAVVETQVDRGARLSLYDQSGLVAATPHIGRTHRWLAPIGAADLNGDGALEFAYVDRPHLARTIRIWRFDGHQLTHMADLPGFTNHRIGEDNIAGGIRSCGGAPAMIVADANWRRIVAVRWDGRAFSTNDLGPHQGRDSFVRAMNCR